MSRRRRVLFAGLMILLWTFVAGIAAELFLTIRAIHIDKSNRYVKAMPFRGFCPDLDAHGNPFPCEDGITETPPITKPPKPEDNFGTHFLTLNETDRADCAHLKDRVIAIYLPDGTVAGLYGDPATIPGLPELVPLKTASTKGSKWTQPATDALAAIKRWLETDTNDCVALQLSDGVKLEMCGYPTSIDEGNSHAVVATFQNITGGLTLTEQQNRLEPGAASRWLIPFFEYKQNVDFGPRWRSNNMGFRDNDVIVPKPTDVFRIVCVGGSTTEEGRVNDVTYPNMIEKQLNEHFNGTPHIEVINGGVVGLDSTGERRRTFDYIALEPDLIIEYNGVNDICHNFLPRWQNQLGPLRNTLRHSRVIQWLAPYLTLPPEDRIEQDFQETMHNLRLMHEIFQKHGIDMAICSFAHPDLSHLRREERDFYNWDFYKNWQGKYYTFTAYCNLVDTYNRMVKTLTDELNIYYIPLAENLTGGTVYFGDICHLRPKGIEEKAEIITKAVEPIITEWVKTQKDTTK